MKEEDIKKTLSEHEIPNGFIKVTERPITSLSSEQKAQLNRKGNVLFNQGNIDAACRIYITTGYSDGLTRIGDFYLKKNKTLEALKYYVLAHNKNKSDSIYEKLSKVLAALLK